MCRTVIDALQTLNLLNWDVLACGRHRGWVTTADIQAYSFTCMAGVSGDDEDLPVLAELAAAEKLTEWEIDEGLRQLTAEQSGQGGFGLDCWRLAKLVHLQSQELDWDEKVVRLEEIYGEFGFPDDMRGCTRYSSVTTDPLDEMDLVIVGLKTKLGVD